jgi:hypothetical protein
MEPNAAKPAEWWADLSHSAKGRIAEMKVLQRALVKGWTASVTQPDARYDLVLDDGQRLWRTQVKWAGTYGTPGATVVSLTRWAGNGRDRPRGKTRRYSPAEIDAVIAYVPPIDRLVWFDGEHLTKSSIQVRYQPAGNGQKRGVLYAADFQW